MVPLRTLPRAPSANLQLDLKLLEGRELPDSAIVDAAATLEGLADAIVVGSHHLEDARRLAAAIPGAGSATTRCWPYRASQACASLSACCATWSGAGPA